MSQHCGFNSIGLVKRRGLVKRPKSSVSSESYESYVLRTAPSNLVRSGEHACSSCLLLVNAQLLHKISPLRHRNVSKIARS